MIFMHLAIILLQKLQRYVKRKNVFSKWQKREHRLEHDECLPHKVHTNCSIICEHPIMAQFQNLSTHPIQI